MKAALDAWGMKPNAFAQGLARQTTDAATVRATSANPGVVLRRALGTKGAFTKDPSLQTVKSGPKKKAAKPPKADPAKMRRAEEALEKARERHRARLTALDVRV
jgi:colicin import membrane protein